METLRKFENKIVTPFIPTSVNCEKNFIYVVLKKKNESKVRKYFFDLSQGCH